MLAKDYKLMTYTEIVQPTYLTLQDYTSIHQGAATIEKYIGPNAALKALELTARIRHKPTITKDVRAAFEQRLPQSELSTAQQGGDTMVIIFHNEPRYPILQGDSESTRRQKRQVIERIRNLRGMTTQELAESWVEDAANHYIALESTPSPDALSTKAFLEDMLVGEEVPAQLQGVTEAVLLFRQAFFALTKETV